MRYSKIDKQAKIKELYNVGWSYRQLQKRFHCSPGYIARLVKGVEVKCVFCGKEKGKTRFHEHHPDKDNEPDRQIPACPSCHAKEEAKIRKERESQPQKLIANKIPLTTTETRPASTYYGAPLSGKDLLIGFGIFYALKWIASRGQSNNPGRRAIMGLKRSH